jgi:hypothetical protein
MLGICHPDAQRLTGFIRESITFGDSARALSTRASKASSKTSTMRPSVGVLTSTRGLPWTVTGFRASWGAELNREIMEVMRERRLAAMAILKWEEADRHD